MFRGTFHYDMFGFRDTHLFRYYCSHAYSKLCQKLNVAFNIIARLSYDLKLHRLLHSQFQPNHQMVILTLYTPRGASEAIRAQKRF